MKLKKITVTRYRSISKISINFKDGIPLIICGANNVGKTNFLRALDLFFSLDKDKFDKDVDIPYDIAVGRSTGGRYNTTFEAAFIGSESKTDVYSIKVVFRWKKDVGNEIKISAKKNNEEISSEAAQKIIKGFRYMFVEASNINIPKVINEILDEEILPVGLDPLRAKQTKPLEIFSKFVDESEKSVAKIEKDVGEILNDFICDVPGIDTKGWCVKILFAEYQKLREALSGIIDFTLYDKNEKKMESKGSGIQRMVFLALLKYMANHSKKKIIWGIDEPEAFLQPSLQRKVFNVLCDISQKQNVFITTHSPHFIDLYNLQSTFLFQANYSERTFAKTENEIFYRVETYVKDYSSESEKIQSIKTHLGLQRNDGWQILPENIVVEGEEDKAYLEILIRSLGFPEKNIVWSGGASKIGGYLQYYNNCAKELSFKPKFLAIFDEDEEGREQSQKIKPKGYTHIEVKLLKLPRHDRSLPFNDKIEWEIEDFLPNQLIFEAINKVLRKNKYKVITKTQIRNRFSEAHRDTQILEYADNCCRQNNPQKKPLYLTSHGRKKEICLRFCEDVDFSKLKVSLTDHHKSFIEKMVV